MRNNSKEVIHPEEWIFVFLVFILLGLLVCYLNICSPIEPEPANLPIIMQRLERVEKEIENTNHLASINYATLSDVFHMMSIHKKLLIQKINAKVRVTFYEPHPDQTDSTPTINASNERVKIGTCAVSRQMEKDFELEFGDSIYVDGLGFFHFKDRMNKKIKGYVIDIFVWKDALELGVKHPDEVYILKGL
jgi:hypothetical protein